MALFECKKTSDTEYAPQKIPFSGTGTATAYPKGGTTNLTGFLIQYPDFTPFENGLKYIIAKGDSYNFNLSCTSYNQSGWRYSSYLYVYDKNDNLIDTVSVTNIGGDRNAHSSSKVITVPDFSYVRLTSSGGVSGDSGSISSTVTISEAT